jgi:rhomboid protease GluP
MLTGIAASAASLYWNDYVVSAGASGAIFGLYGVFLALLLFKVVSAQVRQQLLTSIMLFVGFNLLYGIKDGIDNAAHIGGLLSGFAFALGMVPFFKSTTQSNLQTYVLLGQSVLILAICQVIYFSKDNVAATYDAKLAEFGNLEDKALDILRYADESDIPALQRKISIEGVALWEEAHQLIADLQDLDLPEQLYTQNLRFMSYCNLRIKSYRCIATSLTDTTGVYEDSIVYYQRTIDELFLQPE